MQNPDRPLPRPSAPLPRPRPPAPRPPTGVSTARPGWRRLLVGAAILTSGLASYIAVLVSDGTPVRLAELRAGDALTLAAGSEPESGEERLARYLARSTLMALDDAHRTGNYAVLRELASPSFQAANSAARLADAFAAQRRQEIDLSVAALAIPEWSATPSVGTDNILRLSGSFTTQGASRIRFALAYAAAGGTWKLYEIHVGAEPTGPESIKSAGLR